MAATLRKDNLRGRMIDQDAQKLAGGVTGGPYDPYLYILI